MVVEVEKEFGIEGKSKRESKRRAHLGIIETSLSLSPEFDFWDFWVDHETVLTREQRFAMLGRSKFYLSARSFVEEEWAIWDSRREWNRIWSPIKTVADVFSSLKHSYSSLLPSHCRLHAKDRPKFYDRSGNSDSVNVVQYEDDDSRAHLKDIARSHSIRLDPVDAPKELFKYRKRIQRIIAWAYANGLVPTMMTLTTFHRWDNLKELCNVLRKSWQSLMGSHWGRRWRKSVDLQGFICRQEETINDTEENNSGWHPHYHVILFVPRELVQTLSDSEVSLREQWLKWIKKYYHEETGKEIPDSYNDALTKHGLVFSRLSEDGKEGYAGDLRPVKDSNYLAKIMGYDPFHVYGGDSELTSSSLKDSKVPFDLLLKVTSTNIDLWCEYALATKGLSCFRFSIGLQKKVDEFFEAHPDLDPASKKSSEQKSAEEKTLFKLDQAVYKFFYREHLVQDVLNMAKNGVEAFCQWVKDTCGRSLILDLRGRLVFDDAPPT